MNKKRVERNKIKAERRKTEINKTEMEKKMERNKIKAERKKAEINKTEMEEKVEIKIGEIGNVIKKLVVGLILIGTLCYGYYYCYLTDVGYQIVSDPIFWLPIFLFLTFAILFILYYLLHGIIKFDTSFLLFPSLLMAIGAIVYFVISHPLHSIETRMNEYTNISGLHQDLSGEYINGRVLAVNKDTNRIDELYFKLSDDLRARTSEEIKTIIWVECENFEAGSYTDGAKAYRVKCKLKIIDPVKATFVDTVSFVGGVPTSIKSGGGSEFGSRPNEEMAKYIMALPRQ